MRHFHARRIFPTIRLTMYFANALVRRGASGVIASLYQHRRRQLFDQADRIDRVTAVCLPPLLQFNFSFFMNNAFASSISRQDHFLRVPLSTVDFNDCRVHLARPRASGIASSLFVIRVQALHVRPFLRTERGIIHIFVSQGRYVEHLYSIRLRLTIFHFISRDAFVVFHTVVFQSGMDHHVSWDRL